MKYFFMGQCHKVIASCGTVPDSDSKCGNCRTVIASCGTAGQCRTVIASAGGCRTVVASVGQCRTVIVTCVTMLDSASEHGLYSIPL